MKTVHAPTFPNIEQYSSSRKLFQILETQKTPSMDAVFRVLKGQLLGHVVRQAVKPEVCRMLVEAFQVNPGVHRRNDGVPANCLGADQYGKSLQAYFHQVNEVAPFLATLFQRPGNPMEPIKAQIKEFLQGKAIDFRSAAFQGKTAGNIRAVQWLPKADGSKYTLEPHDDTAQLHQTGQAGFEVQSVVNPIATNFYACNPRGQGSLKIWNLRPDQQLHRHFGIQETGFPFPYEPLNGIEFKRIEIEMGDLIFLNGAFIHAVENSDDLRLLFSFFMGFTHSHTVVTWT